MSQAADGALALEGTEKALEGSMVGEKYRVVRLIGIGGMGTVWLGEHVKLGTRVAIKFIRPQYATRADARQRFEIEAKAAASVSSKHAVKVFDDGVHEGGLPYIVMEYLEGESLSEALTRRGAFPVEEAAKIVLQASRALSRAHAAGVVHRDLKPDNIFLATNIESDSNTDLGYVVKLVDFGIAKILDVGQGNGGLKGPTQDGSVIGTPNFMSPEQLTVGGTPGPLTDIWGLGACAFAAFTGRIPFDGDVLGDIVLKVCIAPLPLPSQFNPEADDALDQWFLRACHRDPTKRFQSIEEMAKQLQMVVGLHSVRVQTLTEDRLAYMLERSQPTALEELANELPSGGMNAKTALLAGIVVGITMVVGLLGFLAWRDHAVDDVPEPPNGPVSSPMSLPAR